MIVIRLIKISCSNGSTIKPRCTFFLSPLGIGVNLLLINPEKALKLAVNDQLRQMYGGRRYFLGSETLWCF